MKFLIIGSGGSSHHISTLLSMIKSIRGKVEFWDGDVFEMGNISRQHLALNNIGKNKAEAMAEYYEKTLCVPCDAVPHYFHSGSLAPEDNTVIINLSDNHKCRRESRNWCYGSGALLFASAAQTDYGNAWIWHPEFQSTEADPFKRYPELETEDGDDPIRRSGGCGAAINETPQSIFSNYMSASMLTTLFHNWMINSCSDQKHNIGEIFFVKNKITTRTINELFCNEL